MRGYYAYLSERDSYVADTERASYKGVALKTGILLLITIGIAVGTILLLPTLLSEYLTGFYITLIIASIVGFISAIVGRLSDSLAKVCSIIYTVCEGLLLGTVTCIVDAYAPGTGILAVFATLVIFAVMLTLYSFGLLKTGIIRVILLGICLGALTLFIFDMIFMMIYGSVSFGLALAIQAFLLLYGVITLTFNFMEADAVVKSGCPKKTEWSVALGLTISLIYIYIYVLRIVALFAGNRR